MIPEYLVQKYNYGYVHSCELLEEPLVKDLLKENEKLEQENQKHKEVIDKAINLRNKFATKNPLLIFENDDLLNFMNSLLDILEKKRWDK